MKQFNITKEYECEISCTLTPEEKGDPQTMDGPGTPDYPASVDDIYIGVIIKGTSIDITALLNKAQREHLEAVLLEEAEFARDEGSL